MFAYLHTYRVMQGDDAISLLGHSQTLKTSKLDISSSSQISNATKVMELQICTIDYTSEKVL